MRQVAFFTDVSCMYISGLSKSEGERDWKGLHAIYTFSFFCQGESLTLYITGMSQDGYVCHPTVVVVVVVIRASRDCREWHKLRLRYIVFIEEPRQIYGTSAKDQLSRHICLFLSADLRWSNISSFQVRRKALEIIFRYQILFKIQMDFFIILCSFNFPHKKTATEKYMSECFSYPVLYNIILRNR